MLSPQLAYTSCVRRTYDSAGRLTALANQRNGGSVITCRDRPCGAMSPNAKHEPPFPEQLQQLLLVYLGEMGVPPEPRLLAFPMSLRYSQQRLVD